MVRVTAPHIDSGDACMDGGTLAHLVPVGALARSYLDDLAGAAQTHELVPGETIAGGEPALARTLYLLEGELELRRGKELLRTVRSATEDARFALQQLAARDVIAHARSRCRLLGIDRALVSTLLICAPPAETRAHGATSTTEWVVRMLQSELFSRIPPANVQRVFKLMERVAVHAGDALVRQGEPGDYYYIVAEGRCAVTWQPAPDAEAITLAELRAGDTFGEEALVSGARRNATVAMLSDGVVMRLTKDDFLALVKRPLIREVSRERADELVAAGMRWLDARLPEEHANDGIPGSLSIPLAQVRSRARELSREHGYVVYCNAGRRSAAAAFLLGSRGFDVRVLEGGLLGDTTGDPAPAGETPAANLHAELAVVSAELETALRHKVAADVAVAAAQAAEGSQRYQELRDQQTLREADASRAAELLAAAQRRKLELEARVREAEAEARATRARNELRVEQLRKCAEERLHAEEQRLQQEYAQAAAEMEKVKRTRQEAEARFADERRRLAAQLDEARVRTEHEAKRIRLEMARAKRDVDETVARIVAQQAAEERELQQRTEARLRSERQRLEHEFSQSVEAQECARQELAQAEAARLEAVQEAERVAAELRAAEAGRRASETARAKERESALLEQSRRARAELEQARKTQDEALTGPGNSTSDAPGEAAAEDEEHLRAALAERQLRLNEASQRVAAAQKASENADRARREAEELSWRAQATEEELRVQLFEEAESWLSEERRKTEEELERARRAVEELGRAEQEKARRLEQEAAADEALLSDVEAMLEGREDTARERVLLTRTAQEEAAAEKQRAREALARARAHLAKLRDGNGGDDA